MWTIVGPPLVSAPNVTDNYEAVLITDLGPTDETETGLKTLITEELLQNKSVHANDDILLHLGIQHKSDLSRLP